MGAARRRFLGDSRTSQISTHSKVMAWGAMDRGVSAIERFGLNSEAKRWRAIHEEIHKQVCREGFLEDLNWFVQFWGSNETDASLGTLPAVGFWRPERLA